MNQVIPAQLRQREADLIATLKANRLEPCMRALSELLQDRLEKSNQMFLTCGPDEFLALQARAFVYARLLKEINA